MSLHTVFVTNRDEASGGDSYHGFGNQLNTSTAGGLSYRYFNLKYDKKKHEPDPVVDENPEQNISKICDKVIAEDNGRPWIFFLHGNNQTTRKNLNKAARIQELYKVNLVVFSWPSRSYDDWKLTPWLIALSFLIMTTRVFAFAVGKQIREKGKQYAEARDMACASPVHLKTALEAVHENLFKRLDDGVHKSFLAHSLGNLLLKNFTANHTPNMEGFKFNTCVMHQADVTAEDTPSWLGNIKLSETENVHVTHNNKDKVLCGARLLSALSRGISAKKRAGAAVNKRHRVVGVEYHDFTGKDGVGGTHGVAWEDGIECAVLKVMRPILTGETKNSC